MKSEIQSKIARSIAKVKQQISAAAKDSGRNPNEIRLLAVSKTQPPEAIAAAYSAGLREFGENYAQELRDKAPLVANFLGTSPKWHFIGHLQTNKCKYIAPYCRVVHSLDSLALAHELSKLASRYSTEFSVLLQINTSGEASKSGCTPKDMPALAELVSKIAGIRIDGLMTIAGLDSDHQQTRKEFALLRECRTSLAGIIGKPEQQLELSMGMSHDFPEAIAEGATIVRIGSLIFGARP